VAIRSPLTSTWGRATCGYRPAQVVNGRYWIIGE
jgi:hypothetical protein